MSIRIKRRARPEVALELPGTPAWLARIYAARGIHSADALDKSLQALLPFDTLKDIQRACVRLEKALREKERILVIGDFDADGATSSALAISALRQMGAHSIDFLVPNRFAYGYGLTPGLVGVAVESRPQLLITVDNGIASIEGVQAANAHGIDVLVTDHHLAGETLPEACAIVNPNQPGDSFPSKSIAGVGVIFYVMLALRRHLVDTGYFEASGIRAPNMAQFLDFVALGTVADVVGLDKNNRILVDQGLSRIREGKCRPGIKALAEVSGRAVERLRETDLGFAIAPRLNAAGRLDDMSLGIECLLCEDAERARMLAEELDALNIERRGIEAEMKTQAMDALDRLAARLNQNSAELPPGLALYEPTWHQGVIGILAGRIKERYHRPVIAFANADGSELKGSARSVAGINIRDCLADIDKDNPGLIKKFGGHAMAAGLSIAPEAFVTFREAFVLEVAKHLDVSACEGVVWTDGELEPSLFTLETAQLLQQAGPWGQQFPEPAFDGIFEVLEQRLVGQHHLKLTLAHPLTGEALDAIAFGVDTSVWPNHRATHIEAAFRLDVNVFRNRARLQLIIEAFEVAPAAEVVKRYGVAHASV